MSADSALPSVNLSLNAPNDPKQLVTTLNVIALLTLLVLAPSLILVMTSFTRLIVVFLFKDRFRHATNPTHSNFSFALFDIDFFHHGT